MISWKGRFYSFCVWVATCPLWTGLICSYCLAQHHDEETLGSVDFPISCQQPLQVRFNSTAPWFVYAKGAELVISKHAHS